MKQSIIKDSEGENKKMKSKNGQKININLSCDRTHTLIMVIKSAFTASNSNTQHYMVAGEIDSNTSFQRPRRKPSKLPPGMSKGAISINHTEGQY